MVPTSSCFYDEERPEIAIAMPSADARQSSSIAATYHGTDLELAVQSGFAVRDLVMRKKAAGMDTFNRVPAARGTGAWPKRRCVAYGARV